MGWTPYIPSLCIDNFKLIASIWLFFSSFSLRKHVFLLVGTLPLLYALQIQNPAAEHGKLILKHHHVTMRKWTVEISECQLKLMWQWGGEVCQPIRLLIFSIIVFFYEQCLSSNACLFLLKNSVLSIHVLCYGNISVFPWWACIYWR